MVLILSTPFACRCAWATAQGVYLSWSPLLTVTQ
nr:MAG TPA: hypothetical protein [Bacteriophage sp.]